MNDALEIGPVAFAEQGRLVEANNAVRDVREEAVEDHEMKVEPSGREVGARSVERTARRKIRRTAPAKSEFDRLEEKSG